MNTRSHFDHTAPKSIAAQWVRVAHNINDQTRFAQHFAPRRFGARRLRASEQSSDLPSYIALARASRANTVRFECTDQRDRSINRLGAGERRPSSAPIRSNIRVPTGKESIARGRSIKGAFARRAKAEGSSFTK